MMTVAVHTEREHRASVPVSRGARESAECGLQAMHRFVTTPANRAEVECALRIRAVENALYDAFGRGKLHGTIHTCIGQEFSGALLGRHLREHDFVTSNHRCHGHYIAATGEWRGLIDEIVGNAHGVCAGIGSSQHLWARNFISNGQQGGLLPVASGVALDRKLKGNGGVAVSFLGEGTLGEGIVYETLNLDSLWQLPHVLICENNFYSQSTPQAHSVAGEIAARAAAFSVRTAAASTWDLDHLDAVLQEAMEMARLHHQPTFVTLMTYRLNPHSKGDDNRESTEVAWFREHDPATLAVRDYPELAIRYQEFVEEAAEAVAEALEKPPLACEAYFTSQLPVFGTEPASWSTMPKPSPTDPRIAQQLNTCYHDWLEGDRDACFLGEDIADPYGGAFKISKGFTTKFGFRVRSTPISEAAICGIGIGLAISGRRSLVEIMFGDFITYAFDQIVNNASKMFHMYNGKVSCPVVVRTPVGARRGYGPTHSQSLERFLIGIDNCCTFSLNSLVPICAQIEGLKQLRCPALLLENKTDYSERTFLPPAGYFVALDDALLPTVRVAPEHCEASVTLLAYSGMARFVADRLMDIFERTDALPELIAPTSLSPLNLQPISDSVRRTGHLVIVEEGPEFGSVGAEVVAQLSERLGAPFRVSRLGARPVPIPSAPALEAATLPSLDEICGRILAVQEEAA